MEKSSIHVPNHQPEEIQSAEPEAWGFPLGRGFDWDSWQNGSENRVPQSIHWILTIFTIQSAINGGRYIPFSNTPKCHIKVFCISIYPYETILHPHFGGFTPPFLFSDKLYGRVPADSILNWQVLVRGALVLSGLRQDLYFFISKTL